MLIQLIRGGYSGKEIVFYLLIMLLALTLTFSVHEFMHAFVAYKLGDPTAKNLGRVTLNPMAHVDPIGAILLLIAGIGWGRPVPYNPNRLNRFKNRTLMAIMVHLAGVTGNFILALISRIITTIMYAILGTAISTNPLLMAIFYIFSFVDGFSMSLLAFNLIPIPPLDGFHVLEELLPYKFKSSNGYRTVMHYGPQILMILIILGNFAHVPVLTIIMDVIKFPFNLLINIFCTVIGLFFL